MTTIFVLKHDRGGIIRMYSQFKKAQEDLYYNYYRHMDCKAINLRIEEYNLIEGEYKSSNVTYTYNFDGTTQWMDIESFGPHLFVKNEEKNEEKNRENCGEKI